MIHLIPILALMLLAIDYRITAFNMHVPWNGYGCVADVVKGRAMLPMQYRVFVPWLTWIAGGTVSSYLAVKYAGLLFMLYACAGWINVLGLNVTVGTLALCAFVPLTMRYDYADAYWELGFFALAFSLIYTGANVWILAAVILIGMLNRETMIFSAVAKLVNDYSASCFAISTTGFVLIAVAIGISLTRIIYGKRKRYCRFNLIKTNWGNIQTRRNLLEYIISMGLIIFFVLLVIPQFIPMSGLVPFVVAMTLFLIAILIPGMWDESRIFLPLTTIIIPLTIRGL